MVCISIKKNCEGLPEVFKGLNGFEYFFSRICLSPLTVSENQITLYEIFQMEFTEFFEPQCGGNPTQLILYNRVQRFWPFWQNSASQNGNGCLIAALGIGFRLLLPTLTGQPFSGEHLGSFRGGGVRASTNLLVPREVQPRTANRIQTPDESALFQQCATLM
jgi:hypothetical protein